MDQVQSHAGPESLSSAPAPSTEQIPRTQSQMFRSQEPDSDVITGDLIGQQLAHLPFEAGRITRLKASFAPSAFGLDLLGGASKQTGVEFFFANRSR